MALIKKNIDEDKAGMQCRGITAVLVCTELGLERIFVNRFLFKHVVCFDFRMFGAFKKLAITSTSSQKTHPGHSAGDRVRVRPPRVQQHAEVL